MSEVVLDSSAVLAILQDEPGALVVRENLPGALLSTVNLAEVVTKLCARGMSIKDARAAVDALDIALIDYDAEQACQTGGLRLTTLAAGLSLGDRACLALAMGRKTSALTSDQTWARLEGFEVVLIR